MQIMKYTVIIAVWVTLLLSACPVAAQPKARAAQQEENNAKKELSLRAQTRYPRSKELPQDVVWMREVYRTLDMTKDANGALYYPVEPMGERTNLFTLLFRLVAQKKIPAYEYQLDGTERLTPDYQIKFRDVLDRFQILYEQKKLKDRRDSVLVIDNSDMPSAEILSYFIKEVWYFDQRTSTYGSVITAICPVMHRAEEFSSERAKLPMFWVDYKDLAPYLSTTSIMASNLNNASNRTIDDFFTGRLYRGDIYKTTNLQNRVLAQYCETDSALVKEQKRIEMELVNFEKSLYGTDTLSVAARDSVVVTKEKQKTKAVQTNSKKVGGTKSASTKRQTVSKRESAAPKASVRRQRR